MGTYFSVQFTDLCMFAHRASSPSSSSCLLACLTNGNQRRAIFVFLLQRKRKRPKVLVIIQLRFLRLVFQKIVVLTLIFMVQVLLYIFEFLPPNCVLRCVSIGLLHICLFVIFMQYIDKRWAAVSSSSIFWYPKLHKLGWASLERKPDESDRVYLLPLTSSFPCLISFLFTSSSITHLLLSFCAPLMINNLKNLYQRISCGKNHCNLCGVKCKGFTAFDLCAMHANMGVSR
jgi:hypothetical protein